MSLNGVDLIKLLLASNAFFFAAYLAYRRAIWPLVLLVLLFGLQMSMQLLVATNDVVNPALPAVLQAICAFSYGPALLALVRKLAWQQRAARSVAYEKNGNMQSEQGNSAAALESYSASHTIAQNLASSDPGNSKWQRQLSVSYNKIGNMQKVQGDSAAALKSYSASLAIREKLANNGPGNAEWQQDLASSLMRTGDMQREQGDSAAVLKCYTASLAIAKKLTSSDASNTEWQRMLAMSYTKISVVYLDQDKQAAALASLAAALPINQKLALANPNNAEWQVDLARSIFLIAMLDAAPTESIRVGRAQEAIALLQKLESAGRLPAAGAKLLEKIQQIIALNLK